MIKDDVPVVKLSRKLPFASVRVVAEEEVEQELCILHKVNLVGKIFISFLMVVFMWISGCNHL